MNPNSATLNGENRHQKIVITEFMDAQALPGLQAQFQVHYDPQLVDKPEELSTLIADADALIVRNRTQVRPALLQHAKQLKVVGRLGVGLDNIDVVACESRNIRVIPATGANALSVAEYAVCTAVMLLRGAYLSSADVAAGKWPRAALSSGREAAGKTMGLIGFGMIGQLTAKLAHSLGMRTLAYDPALKPEDPIWSESGAQCASLEEVFARSDAINLHIPLLDSTKHLVNAARIAQMKPGAIVINTARGGIIDESALANALRQGHLGGAALDVFEIEPLTDQHPFTGCPNLILTPHIAGVSFESNERVSSMIADAVSQALSE
jgi:(S)-sulfolactate dehydrogenase